MPEANAAEAANELTLPQAAGLIGKMLEAEERGENTAQESDGPPDAQEAESTPETEDGGEGQETEPEDKDGEEAETEDTPESDKTLVEVTLPGGEKTKITLEELAKGYSREADYTNKTKTLADERQTFNAEKQAELGRTQQEREQYTQRLQEVELFLQSQEPKITPEQWADWEMNDPTRFAIEKIKLQERHSNIESIKKQRTELQEKTKAEQQQALQDFMRSQIPILHDFMPEAKDPKKWEAKSAEMKSYLKEIGFTDAEQVIYDARLVRVINDALKGRATVDKKQVVAKKLAEAPRMVSPSAAQTKGERGRIAFKQAKDKVRQTGKVSDAAAAIKQLM